MSNIIHEDDISDSAENAGQYLTFMLDGEVFATDIRKIREVLEHTQVTRVPRSHESMQGVINLRGKAIPVVDMRLQFGMASAEVTVDTCIIIIEVKIKEKTTVLGALVDSVMEVIDLKSDQMEDAPDFGSRVNNDFIEAIGKFGDRFVIVLDMNRTFSSEQLGNIQESCADKTVVQDAA